MDRISDPGTATGRLVSRLSGGDLNSRRDLPAGADQLKNTFWIAPIYPSTKGDGNGIQYGLVNPVRLVAAGPAYTEDVFIKPSVRNKELVAGTTLFIPIKREG